MSTDAPIEVKIETPDAVEERNAGVLLVHLTTRRSQWTVRRTFKEFYLLYRRSCRLHATFWQDAHVSLKPSTPCELESRFDWIFHHESLGTDVNRRSSFSAVDPAVFAEALQAFLLCILQNEMYCNSRDVLFFVLPEGDGTLQAAQKKRRRRQLRFLERSPSMNRLRAGGTRDSAGDSTARHSASDSSSEEDDDDHRNALHTELTFPELVETMRDLLEDCVQLCGTKIAASCRAELIRMLGSPAMQSRSRCKVWLVASGAAEMRSDAAEQVAKRSGRGTPQQDESLKSPNPKARRSALRYNRHYSDNLRSEEEVQAQGDSGEPRPSVQHKVHAPYREIVANAMNTTPEKVQQRILRDVYRSGLSAGSHSSKVRTRFF